MVKYDIELNGKVVASNLNKKECVLEKLSEETVYKGCVIAKDGNKTEK